MRIGVVPNLDRSIGGAYQYAVTLVGALPDLGLADEFVLFLYAGEELPSDLADTPYPAFTLRTMRGPAGSVASLISKALPPKLRASVRRAAGRVIRHSGPGRDSRVDSTSEVDPLWAGFFAEHGIELLVFTNDSDLSFKTGVPYVVAIHDLQHRLHPEFEEVSADGEGERREYRVGNAVRGAVAVLVDSEVGAEDMADFYGPEGVAPGSVFALPFLPADYLGTDVSQEARDRVRTRWNLPDTYLFYPSQFSPSKNHERVVRACACVTRSGVPAHLVLAGPRSGALRERTFSEVMSTVAEEGMGDLVHYLGYVPDEDMSAMYAESAGLVMPTFFGPTNIPVLEAWRVGCPVITSDIRGIREQAGDAALLVDPDSVDQIADAVRRLLTEPATRGSLARKGHARLASYTRADYLGRLSAALTEAKRRVVASRAGSPDRTPTHEGSAS